MCDFQSTFLILLYRIFHSMCAIKKAFDRVWHVALWATMKKYNMSHGLVCSIKSIYSNATSEVFHNGSIASG